MFFILMYSEHFHLEYDVPRESFEIAFVRLTNLLPRKSLPGSWLDFNFLSLPDFLCLESNTRLHAWKWYVCCSWWHCSLFFPYNLWSWCCWRRKEKWWDERKGLRGNSSVVIIAIHVRRHQISTVILVVNTWTHQQFSTQSSGYVCFTDAVSSSQGKAYMKLSSRFSQRFMQSKVRISKKRERMMKKVQRESGHDHETMEKRMHQETAQKSKTGRVVWGKTKLMLGSVFASFFVEWREGNCWKHLSASSSSISCFDWLTKCCKKRCDKKVIQ